MQAVRGGWRHGVVARMRAAQSARRVGWAKAATMSANGRSICSAVPTAACDVANAGAADRAELRMSSFGRAREIQKMCLGAAVIWLNGEMGCAELRPGGGPAA